MDFQQMGKKAAKKDLKIVGLMFAQDKKSARADATHYPTHSVCGLCPDAKRRRNRSGEMSITKARRPSTPWTDAPRNQSFFLEAVQLIPPRRGLRRRTDEYCSRRSHTGRSHRNPDGPSEPESFRPRRDVHPCPRRQSRHLELFRVGAHDIAHARPDRACGTEEDDPLQRRLSPRWP